MLYIAFAKGYLAKGSNFIQIILPDINVVFKIGCILFLPDIYRGFQD